MEAFSAETIRIFLKKNVFFVIVAISGLIVLGYGLIRLSKQPSSSDEVTLETKAESSASAAIKNPSTISVDVEGGVVNPGVYQLAQGSRLQEALIKAGGLSQDADRAWVAKSVNLALKLSDATKIYIPLQGEKKIQNQAAGVLGAQSLAGDTIDINSASEQQLDSLPAIGSVTAQKIIAGRPYSQIDELVSKKILGQKIFEKIKDKISAN